MTRTLRRDRPTTPGTIVRMARDGFGVDDMRVRTGWSYREIAEALATAPRLMPWAKLAARRAVAEREERAA